MKKIFLITIGLSVCVFADFSKNGHIVTDNRTGLQWQDNAQAGTIRKEWQEAIAHCEALSLGGFSDWRLPNVNELVSLVDDTRYSPAIDTAFDNVASSNYWSSTTNASYSYFAAWIVSFGNGYQKDDGIKNYSYYVRCVRAG